MNDILNSKWSPCWHRTKSWAAFSFHWRRDSTTVQLSSINVQPVKKKMWGGGGGTDVNTDKGWFECASAAKSGSGGEWQKKKKGGEKRWPVEKRRRDRSEGS